MGSGWCHDQTSWKRVYIPLPGEEARQTLFDINLKNLEIYEDVDFEKLIELTKGYSGADISNVCWEAAMMPMRRKLD